MELFGRGAHLGYAFLSTYAYVYIGLIYIYTYTYVRVTVRKFTKWLEIPFQALLALLPPPDT